MNRILAHLAADFAVSEALNHGHCPIEELGENVYVCTKEYMSELTGEPCTIEGGYDGLIYCDEERQVFEPLDYWAVVNKLWEL